MQPHVRRAAAVSAPHPHAIYTQRVVQKAVEAVYRDGLAMRCVPDRLARDFCVKRDEVQGAARKLFEGIQTANPARMRYTTYKLPEGVTYKLPEGVSCISVLQLDDGMDKPLQQIKSARQFHTGLKDSLAERPSPQPVTTIGTFG